MSAHGYVKIRVGALHPCSDPNGYCYEHILVIYSQTGERLLKGQIIHHINGDRTDNRIANLEVMTIGEHNRKHPRKRDPQTGRFLKYPEETDYEQ